MKIVSTLFLLITFSFSAFSSTGVANITALQGFAEIKRSSQNIKATLGATIEQKDIINTKDNTKLQLIFKDETIVSIGKNSSFSVNEYIFEDGQEPIIKFGMIRGAMRTITGKIGDIAPKKFSVTTKTATIGIRGTNFSVFIAPDGSSKIFCTFGAISVLVKEKTHIINQGFFILISPEKEIDMKRFTPKILKTIKKKYFATNILKKHVPLKNENTQGAVKNNEQLVLTTTDNSILLIDETITSTKDSLQTSLSDIASLLVGYTNNVTYTGQYTVTSSPSGTWTKDETGTAKLDVDFNADTAKLSLLVSGTPIREAKTLTIASPVGATNTLSGTKLAITSGTNSVTGTFGGSVGEKVTGSYSVDNTAGTLATTNDIGTFNVNTNVANLK